MGLLKSAIEQLGRPAILLGNGINLVNDTLPDWNDLLANIGGAHISSKGLTNTEIYDFIELRSDPELDFKKEISRSLNIPPEENLSVHSEFLELIKPIGCPVLTTNFDLSLEQADNLEFFRTRKLGFTRFYPWDTYSGENQLTNPIDGFGIWHIHGMTKYPDSIRLGLTDYMGSVEKARKWIHKGDESIFRGKNVKDWEGFPTWLHIWFNMPLIIVGLGMKPDEVFIRWLLIERKKYFKRYPRREKKTIYLSTGDGERIDNFLFNLNIEHYSTREYKSLYC